MLSTHWNLFLMVGRKPLLWYLQELLTFLAAQSCPRIPRPPLDTSESESEVAQSCPTLCDPVDCSLPGSSVHGIFQAIVLEWIAISFSRGSSQTRDWTQVSGIVDRHFTVWATREVLIRKGDTPNSEQWLSDYCFFLEAAQKRRTWGKIVKWWDKFSGGSFVFDKGQ